MSRYRANNFQSEILTTETIEREGYDPTLLSPTSNKFIWVTCRYCGKPNRTRKSKYTIANNSNAHKECRRKELSDVDSTFSRPDVIQKIRIAKSKPHKIVLELSNLFKSYKQEISSETIYFPEKQFLIYVVLNALHSTCSKPASELRNALLQSSKSYSERGIRAFYIMECDWRDRKQNLLNFIRTILCNNSINVAARKCSFSYNDAASFLEENHIQGSTNVLQYFNLVYNGDIVATMTASRHHRQNADKNAIVLSRLCFKDGYNVQGGASRLFKAFKTWAVEHDYEKVISWSDNKWTEGNIYKVLGFKCGENLRPDYLYWNPSENTYHSKQSQRKNAVACPKHLNEEQWAAERGLYKIFDCGKKRWIYNLK